MGYCGCTIESTKETVKNKGYMETSSSSPLSVLEKDSNEERNFTEDVDVSALALGIA